MKKQEGKVKKTWKEKKQMRRKRIKQHVEEENGKKKKYIGRKRENKE